MLLIYLINLKIYIARVRLKDALILRSMSFCATEDDMTNQSK